MNSETLNKIKEHILPTDKITMAKKDILPLRLPVKQTNRFNEMGKPCGIWYAFGTEWIDWVTNEMPEWMGTYFYKVETTSAVLKISNDKEFDEFSKSYGGQSKFFMDYTKLSKIYAGIEINPHRHNKRRDYFWYMGWDVASGCIWNELALKNITRININSQ